MLENFKWDPQVGDVETLARFPLVIPAEVESDLARLAEELSAEAMAAERELIERPTLVARLGLPRRIRRILADESKPATPAAARVIRFDFHPTAAGWQISEANSDVPGGYTEASHFSRLMAQHWPDLRPAGDPIAAILDAFAETCPSSPRVGLLAAPGYMEDQQVVGCIAAAMANRGWQPVRGRPVQLAWSDGCAFLAVGDQRLQLDAVFRFFQGEWLARLPKRKCWEPLFRGANTPVCNPGIALLTESKRFPLIWDDLETALPVRRALLPATRDPRRVKWQCDDDWILKPAFGNNGDDLLDCAIASRSERWKMNWAIRLSPSDWVAQRRFTILAIDTPRRRVFPCLGVYTVNGRYAGIYGRISAKPFIDYAAIDVAVLVREDSGASA